MRRFWGLILFCVCLLAGCGQEKEEEVSYDLKPCVMVDGVLYGSTGRSGAYRTNETPENGGATDGEITSSVEGSALPAEDDQSNFGTGYSYRYGEAGTVEVYMSESKKWIIFEAFSEK